MLNGLIVNSQDMCFEIPEDDFASVLEKAKFFLVISTTKNVPVKRLASWVENLQSLDLAIVPVALIMYWSW